MRNLKKILALVLALVMSLSLMATAGAASFSDVDAGNQYETAIDVLDALKVFQGYTDGTFRPDGELTRAEAAALVYRIATGDVDGKYVDNYTYMANSKFGDLDGYNWAKGYINYCQNAGIVVGTSATTFNPGGKVTGYQLMVMVLRTLGYGKAGEFSNPVTWELETASKCEQLGMLKNVTAGDFGASAKRAMVAEILFRGLLQEPVTYSSFTSGGYTKTGTTLGKQELGLEEITGVVVANSVADLYNSTPLAEGKTRMLVDGKNYTLVADTEAEAIGLTHHAYIKGEIVLAGLEPAGNVVADPHGAAASVAALAKEYNIKTTDETEYFVNFDPVLKDTSDWRIEYKAPTTLTDLLKLSNTDLHSNGCELKEGFWCKVIRVGAKITAMDLAIIEEIFAYDDAKIDGEVYAGTDTDDLSDIMTWKKFRAEYLNVDENDTIKSSDNGEWLRVIDNNGDGVVDYVLRTDFVMTTVTDYEKRTNVYDVEWKGGLPNGNGKGTIPADAIKKATEDTDLSVGSVILYTLIDGTYYVSNPDIVTLTVDKKSINSKAGTFTANSEPYTWSGIDEEAIRYYDAVSQLAYETKYDMYPDHFGYIRLATETSRNFVLLTDAYYGTDNRKSTMKADLYDGTNAVYDVNVTDGARSSSHWNGDGFIDTYENDHSGNRSTWLRLNTYGEFYQLRDLVTGTTYVHYVDKLDPPTPGINDNYTVDPFHTNIALGSENDGVWNLEDVTDLDVVYNGLYRSYNTYELKSGFKFPATDLWGITSWTGATTYVADQAIQTNGRTLYYYVENPGKHGEDLKVQSWTGYQNVPEALEKATALRAYAVTHNVPLAESDPDYDPIYNTVEKYEIADVVVIEGVPGSSSKNPQLITTGITAKRENALGFDGEKYTEHDTAFGLFTSNQLRTVNDIITTDGDGLYAPQLNFYDATYAGGKAPIVRNFADYGIWAGYVTVLNETKDSDYVEITEYQADPNSKRIAKFYTDDVAAYELNQITSRDWHGTDNIEAIERENIKRGDMLIVMCNGDGAVELVINVSRSGKDGETFRNADGTYNEENGINKLHMLFAAILADQEGDVVSYLYKTFGASLLEWGYIDLTAGVFECNASDLDLAGYVWNDGTAVGIRNAIQVWEETDLGDVNVTSNVTVTVTQVNGGEAKITVTGLNETRYIQIEYALDVSGANLQPEVYTLDEEGYIFHANGDPLYTDESYAPVQILDTVGKVGGKYVNKDFEIGETTATPDALAVASDDGMLSAGETVTLWFNHLTSEPIALGDVEVRTNVNEYLYALDIQADDGNATTQDGYTRYKATFVMPCEEYTFTDDEGEDVTLEAIDNLWIIFWEGEVPIPEVEDGTIGSDLPEDGDVSLDKRGEGETEYDDYEGVAAEYEVNIDANAVENNGDTVEFELYVPVGQLPYVDEDKATNVTSVSVTKREAVASQSAGRILAVEMVDADVYDVVITVTNADTAAKVEILLLEEDYDEPVEVLLTLDVDVAAARLYDTQGTTAAPDDGSTANLDVLYSKYSVTSTKDEDEDDTWNVTINASNVKKHYNREDPASEGYWVGAAFLPTLSKESWTVTDAKLYVKDNDDPSAQLAYDDDCIFTETGMIELANGKGKGVPALIAEYFGCDKESVNDFEGSYQIRIVWTVADENGTEKTFTTNFNVTVKISKLLEAE